MSLLHNKIQDGLNATGFHLEKILSILSHLSAITTNRKSPQASPERSIQHAFRMRGERTH
jgi:hypothetical protein